MRHQQSDIILAIQAEPIDMETFRLEFLALYKPPLASPATEEKYRRVLEIVIEGLEATTTADLVPELVARFIAVRPAGESPFTTRGLLMHLRTIMNYAEGRRYLTISPFRLRKLARWIRVPTIVEGKRHQTRDELRRILDVMRADVAAKKGWALWRARRLYGLTATVGLAALRSREAQCLWVEDLDLAGRTINLVPHGPRLPADLAPGEQPRFKTEGSAQPIAIPAALVPILEDWLAHRLDHPAGWPMPPLDRIPWLFPGSRRVGAWVGGARGISPRDRLQAAAKRAGVEGVTWQSLRRSWATIAEASGIPQALITRQLRHSDAETTKRWYQRRELEALKDAVEGFDF